MPPTVYSVSQLRSILHDRNLKRVADNAGIPYPTLLDLMRGTDSRASTVEKLSLYLVDLPKSES